MERPRPVGVCALKQQSDYRDHSGGSNCILISGANEKSKEQAAHA